MLVLDEKWRRPAAPHLGTGRHAHAARTLAGRITQIELQRHGAARERDRTPNFETRIDPKRGAWPTLPTCVATERAELRQRALGAGREAVAARRRRGGAPRGQAHAQHARESISEVRRAVDAALDAPAPHRRRGRDGDGGARGAADGDGASRRASAPGVGAGRAAAVGAAGRHRLRAAPRARASRSSSTRSLGASCQVKTGEEVLRGGGDRFCFGDAAEAPVRAAEAPIARGRRAEAEFEAEAEEAGGSPWAAFPSSEAKLEPRLTALTPRLPRPW